MRIKAVLESARDKSPAALLFVRLAEEAYPPEEHGKSLPPGGIGLLQIANSSRCHLHADVIAETFAIQVNVSVPEMLA